MNEREVIHFKHENNNRKFRRRRSRRKNIQKYNFFFVLPCEYVNEKRRIEKKTIAHIIRPNHLTVEFLKSSNFCSSSCTQFYCFFFYISLFLSSLVSFRLIFFFHSLILGLSSQCAIESVSVVNWWMDGKIHTITVYKQHFWLVIWSTYMYDVYVMCNVYA